MTSRSAEDITSLLNEPNLEQERLKHRVYDLITDIVGKVSDARTGTRLHAQALDVKIFHHAGHIPIIFIGEETLIDTMEIDSRDHAKLIVGIRESRQDGFGYKSSGSYVLEYKQASRGIQSYAYQDTVHGPLPLKIMQEPDIYADSFLSDHPDFAICMVMLQGEAPHSLTGAINVTARDIPAH